MRNLFSALASSGAVEIVHHPDLHLIALDKNVHRVDVFVGVRFDKLSDIHIDYFVRYVFSFYIDLHTIISFNYSNSCFISYNYIVAENPCNFQLQVKNFHISLLTVNSFSDKKMSLCNR